MTRKGSGGLPPIGSARRGLKPAGKIFELTQELNDYVVKSGDKVASIDDRKKAEQIEKLAKSVRARMKQSF
jgi:hypothetical protein